MDASPHSQSLSLSRGRSNPNPPSRLSQIACSIKRGGGGGGGGGWEGLAPSGLSLDVVVSTPSSLKSSTSSLPPQELLLLSPSPSKRSRTRLVDRLEMADEPGVEPPGGSRKRSKSKAAQPGCASSPRGGSRRLRRRAEVESREERDLAGLMEEIGKVRRRKQGSRAKKEKLPLVVPSVALSTSTSVVQRGDVDDVDGGNLDAMGAAAYDLVMWKDVAKTSLWFGFGFLIFFSSCFAKGINFSIFSGISQLGLLFLGGSFISNTLCQRNDVEIPRSNFKLTDEDILRVGRLVLPAANFAISKTREIFSGEPSMTLKVIPFLLLGAEYGHLLTLRRLFATGFFISFTMPKLYSSYSSQIDQKVECTKCRVLEAWGACSHKKIVAASAITAFWNLSTIKTRLFTAFISLVILRCSRQHLLPKPEEKETAEAEEEQELLHKALVVAI